MRKTKKTISTVIVLVMLLAVLPTVPASAQAVVHANTAEELQNAIASNTEIILKGDTYSFSSVLDIKDVENLTITGTVGTRIVTTSDWDEVVMINDSSNITINSVYIGHEVPRGLACTEGVLYMFLAKNVTVNGCELYGCGITGFSMRLSSAVFNDTIIRDCTYYIGEVVNSTVEFNGCTFKDNGYANSSSGGSPRADESAGFEISGNSFEFPTFLTFTNCTFLNNKNTHFKQEITRIENAWNYDYFTGESFYNAGLTRVVNCTFTGNMWQSRPDIPPPTAGGPTAWAVEQVNSAIEAGLVPLSLQSNYTQATTRAEFCALAVALYESLKGEITGRETFSDTNDVNVQKAASIEVVTGMGNNLFAPDDTLTREQAAVMLARLANAVGKPFLKQAPAFTDGGSVSPWAVEGVGQVQAAGIMGGVGNDRFAPKDPYTREQSIVTIMRVFEALG